MGKICWLIIADGTFYSVSSSEELMFTTEITGFEWQTQLYCHSNHDVMKHSSPGVGLFSIWARKNI